MFIDSSRLKDLDQLKAWMNDYSYSLARRKMFKRTHDKILAQVRDPRLAKLRERLTLATRAGDKLEMWKIMNQIKDYAKEEKLEEGTT